jgi:aminoglycoside phosphotransferase (APT) family kinase protein
VNVADIDELSRSLEAFIARQSGADRVRVSELRRLTGGASRETWALDAAVERDGRMETLPLIWQRDVRGAPKELSREMEFRLMKAAFDEGVPAPEPLWMGDETIGKGESFFVRRIDGETLPRRLLRDDVYADARRLLPAQLGKALAGIHRIDPGKHGLETLPSPQAGLNPAKYEVDRYEQIFRAIAPEPHPAFELAFRWLRAHPVVIDGGGARCLVHGDFRIGNVLFGPEGLRVILDWELAHIGDPMEDMGFICVRSWRFGGPKPVGGIGEREAFFAAYESAGGSKVDPERVRYWEVFGNLRWGIICISQAKAYLDGISNSVELASIGRRTAETEWELLGLIDG